MGAEFVSFQRSKAICDAKNKVIVKRMGEIIALDPVRCPQRLCSLYVVICRPDRRLLLPLWKSAGGSGAGPFVVRLIVASTLPRWWCEHEGRLSSVGKPDMA